MRPVQFTIAPLSTGIAASTTGHIMTVVVLAVVLVLIMVVVVVSAVVMLVLLSVLLSPLLLSVLVLIAVVDMVMLVLAMVVLVLAMVVLVLAMVVLVLAMVVLVLMLVLVLVLVLTPFGQNALPLSKFRLHTNGIFKLQLRSFQAAAITALACPIEIQYSWLRKLLGSNDPAAKLPIHKQSTFCVQQPFMPDDCAHPAYPPALAG